MLYSNRLTEALLARKEDFARFDNKWREEIYSYATRLNALSKKTSEEVEHLLIHEKEPGALPSDELDRHKSLTLSFNQRWSNHEEARRWASSVLQNRTTFAADASQLLPGREISLPVAVVQAAWFENRHHAENDYVKNVRVEIIPPDELLEEIEGRVNAETVVRWRRFQLEIETIKTFLEQKRGWREKGEKTPVAFFDGTLLISISQPRTRLEERYIDRMAQLVRLSRDAQVPLIGYIDQSYARDLVNMLDAVDVVDQAKRSRSLYDAQLLRESGNEASLKFWGDRTTFFYCKRKGLSELFQDEKDKSLVGFTYLQTTGEGTPARLDVPTWIYAAGLLDEVIDVVRAECVSGLGYPYAIEAADAAAVITAQDRERFLGAIQEFAEKNNLGFRVSRKAISKMRRR
jgi:hypothetical protein